MYKKRRINRTPDPQTSGRWNEVNSRLDEVDREFQQLQERLLSFQQVSTDDSAPHDSLLQVLESRLVESNDNLLTIQDQTQQAITQQFKWYEGQVADLRNDIQEQTSQLVAQGSSYLEEIFSESQIQTQDQFQQLQQSVQDIQDQHQLRSAIAEETILNAQNLLQDLSNRHSKEVIFNQEYPGLVYSLEQAKSNLENNFPEAALMGGQQVIQRLASLQSSLERNNQKRYAAWTSTRDQAVQLMQTIHHNRFVQALDFSGNPLPAFLDVDFWSEGKLKPLLRKTRAIVYQLDNPQICFEVQDLDELQKTLFGIEHELFQIVNQARGIILSSQVRFNISQLVYAALRTQGYELKKSWYEANDMRKPYRMVLIHLDGFQVRIRLVPLAEDPLVHTLDLRTKHRQIYTEHELQYRHRELEGALKDYGLNIGQINFKTSQDSIFNRIPSSPDRIYLTNEIPLNN